MLADTPLVRRQFGGELLRWVLAGPDNYGGGDHAVATIVRSSLLSKMEPSHFPELLRLRFCCARRNPFSPRNGGGSQWRMWADRRLWHGRCAGGTGWAKCAGRHFAALACDALTVEPARPRSSRSARRKRARRNSLTPSCHPAPLAWSVAVSRLPGRWHCRWLGQCQRWVFPPRQRREGPCGRGGRLPWMACR